MEKFIVKAKEKLVVCVLSFDKYDSINDEWTTKKYVGKAKCLDSDKFSIEKGKEIAKLRALIKVKTSDCKEFQEDIDYVKKFVERSMKHLKKTIDHYHTCEKEIHSMKEQLVQLIDNDSIDF